MKNRINSWTFYEIIFLLCMSSLMACRKESNTVKETHTEYLSSFLKPYMFKEGSYWVFQNDSTGVLDSIIVKSVKRDFFWIPPSTPSTGSTYEKEYYKINLYDFLNSRDYNDFLFGGIITRNGNGDGLPKFGQPILLPHCGIGIKTYGAEVWDTIPSLYAGGNVFNNVQEMKIIYSEQLQIEFYKDTYLYFKDSVGLVKKEIYLGVGNIESWSLIRWHVDF